MKPATLITAITAAGILGLIWAGGATPARDQVGGPFRLVDDRGHAVTEHSFAGKYLAIYFGYTNCQDVCPATLNTLAAALDRVGAKADRIQPLFITIDPARDTQAVLHRYVTAFSPRLIGLGGTPDAVGRAAAAYRVISSPAPGQGATWNHSSVLYLMAPDGHFLAPVAADSSEAAMAQVLARYVS